MVVPWPQGTDFDTFPAEAAGLPAGTALTVANSIFSDVFPGNTAYSALVLDGTHSHSGALSVSAGGTGSQHYKVFQLAGDAGLVQAVAEDSFFWMFYGADEDYSDGLLRTGADAANTQWLTHYILYSGSIVYEHDNFDYALLEVQVRGRGPGYYGLAEWLEWRVKFLEAGGDTHVVMISPLDTWVKIRVQVPLSGPVVVTLSTDAGELGVATSSASLLRSGQYFALHEPIIRKDGQYGQVWIDDINYDIPAPVIVGRPDLVRRRFVYVRP